MLTPVTVSGNKMPSLDLPESPVAPVQVIDFNGDGYNDLILHTYHGYYGLEQIIHPVRLYFFLKKKLERVYTKPKTCDRSSSYPTSSES